MDRRDFLKMSALALAAPLLPGGALAQGGDGRKDASRSGGKSVFSVLPHIQLLDGRGAVGVVWKTSAKATGYVTWSQDGWKTQARAWREEDGLLDANDFLHSAVIAGFDISKPLLYRVHSRPFARFEAYKVKYSADEAVFEGKIGALIGSDGAVTWAMLNDVHENLAIYDCFAGRLNGIHGFCVFNGDIANHVDSEEQVEKCLLAPLSRISREGSLPVWYLRGNHETRGPFARHLRDGFSLQDGRFYGAITLGGARFVFLDTGEDKPDSDHEYSGLVSYDAYIGRQTKWLQAEVASPKWRNARARIVVQHIPPHTTIPHLDRSGVWKPGLARLDALNGVLKNAGVTLLMGAHLHNWNWHAPTEKRPYPMIVGGGDKLGDPAAHNNATLVKCRLSGDALDVRAIAQDGTVLLKKRLEV